MKSAKKYIPWGVVGLIIIAQFLLSAQSGNSSRELSVSIADRILFNFEAILKTIRLSSEGQFRLLLDGFVRKLAHFLAFFVLGIFTPLAVRLTIPVVRSSKWAPFLISFCILFVIASLDEYHQMFVSGRTMSISDIILDMQGVMTGFAVTFGYHVTKRISAWLQDDSDD